MSQLRQCGLANSSIDLICEAVSERRLYHSVRGVNGINPVLNRIECRTELLASVAISQVDAQFVHLPLPFA